MGPLALVLAPTRELAAQIGGESTAFGGCVGLRSCCVTGGAPKAAQVSGADPPIGPGVRCRPSDQSPKRRSE